MDIFQIIKHDLPFYHKDNLKSSFPTFGIYVIRKEKKSLKTQDIVTLVVGKKRRSLQNIFATFLFVDTRFTDSKRKVNDQVR